MHALRLTTYAELEGYAKAFAAGCLRSLVLIGPPGTGKSSAFKNALGDDVCWIGGNASPFGIFLNSFQHLNKPIVLDDVDDLYRMPQGVRLLKALCQTDSIRTLSWHTQARELDRLEIPREFQTKSSIALIANEWKTLSPNILAIEDRVHLLVFDPEPLEIHQRASNWYWDQEVFEFIGDHLALLATLSLRLYVKSWELKLAGMNWRTAILSQCYEGVTQVVARLRADSSFTTEEARAQAFMRTGHGCRATYFNHAKLLRTAISIPKIVLKNTVPPHATGQNPENQAPRRLRRIGSS